MEKDPLKVTQRAAPWFAGTDGQAEENGHLVEHLLYAHDTNDLRESPRQHFGAGTVPPCANRGSKR